MTAPYKANDPRRACERCGIVTDVGGHMNSTPFLCSRCYCAPEPADVPTPYATIAAEVAELVAEKQKAYGDSFGAAGDFLKLLYPNGVPVAAYGDMLTLVRMFDKMKRIATDKDALGEDPYRDLVGYGLLAVERKVK